MISREKEEKRAAKLQKKEEIEDVIGEAKKEWDKIALKAKDKRGDDLLFTQKEIDEVTGEVVQQSFFDLTEITEAQFWEQSEQL